MENIDSQTYSQLLLHDDLYHTDKTYHAAILKKVNKYQAAFPNLDAITPAKLKEVDARTRYKLLAYDDGYGCGIDSTSISAMEIAKQLRLYELVQDVKNIDLIDAINNNDISLVKQILDKDTEVDWKFLKEPTLHCACKNGFTKIAAMLLEKGANVNLKQGKFLTPLLIAIFKNNRQLLKLLLSRTDIKTARALLAAIYKNNLDLVKVLIRSEIAPSSTDLSEAAVYADVKVLEYLLRNTTFNISKSLMDTKHYEQALKAGKQEMAEYLLFVADMHKAIEGTMPFKDFAQKHLIKHYVSTLKLLGLDEKGDFSRAFCTWEETNREQALKQFKQ